MRHLLILLFISIPFFTVGQQTEEEAIAPIDIWMFKIGGGAYLPGGDLGDRFGPNGMAGGGLHYKTGTNWIFGADADFIFGGTVVEEDILTHLETEGGYLIGTDGTLFQPEMDQRGYRINLTVGKILPVWQANTNSGLMISASTGFLQHKIRYYIQQENQLPQLNDDFKKGYDRLTNGLSFTEMVGYHFMADEKLINFNIGLEFTQAFTKNRRDWNIDQMAKDDRARIDLMFGVRANWILPFYKPRPPEYYY